jgi:hypothetical protein
VKSGDHEVVVVIELRLVCGQGHKPPIYLLVLKAAWRCGRSPMTCWRSLQTPLSQAPILSAYSPSPTRNPRPKTRLIHGTAVKKTHRSNQFRLSVIFPICAVDVATSLNAYAVISL